MKVQLQKLTGMPTQDIHHAFSRAFSDYVEPFDLTQKQLQYMLKRRGFADYLSFGAFSEGEIVGFTLNGAGQWNGKATAYDTGTGVQKAFRKQGIASRIMEVSLPLLKAEGISQYLLEVIKTNRKAVGLYQKLGFLVSREFDYWICRREAFNFQSRSLPEDFSIRRIEDPDWGCLGQFWDFPPSWQNSVDSVERVQNSMTMLGAYHLETPVAYAIMEEGTGDVPQLAVHPEYRRQGLATLLLQELLNLLNPPGLRVINTCSNNTSLKSFLLKLGLEPGFGQYEMVMDF